MDAPHIKPEELAARRQRAGLAPSCAGDRGSAPAPDEERLDAWWHSLSPERKQELAAGSAIAVLGVVS